MNTKRKLGTVDSSIAVLFKIMYYTSVYNESTLDSILS